MISNEDRSDAIAIPLEWKADRLSRVPFWLFQREDVYVREQKRLFRGPVWNYLSVEVESTEIGDYVATYVGDTPVVVTRGHDGQIYAFENRCSHRGSLLALKDRHNVKSFTCVYHAWTYNLEGDLTGVAFKDGIGGKGGMAPTFCMEAHAPNKLRLTVLRGLILVSFCNGVPAIEEYLGDEVLTRIERVLSGRKGGVIGGFTQMRPSNWKLYFENGKDSYHASILHLFFTTFGVNRLSQRGALIVSPSGANHVSYSAIDPGAARDTNYSSQGIRSESKFGLADSSFLEGVDEFGDGVTLQILSVFPGFVLQQIKNAIAVRQILPRGTSRTELNWTYLGFADDTPALRLMRLRQGNLVGPAGYVSMEDGCIGGFVQRGIAGVPDHESVLEMGGEDAQSSESRVTEASIRGFWKAYRREMAL